MIKYIYEKSLEVRMERVSSIPAIYLKTTM